MNHLRMVLCVLVAALLFPLGASALSDTGRIPVLTYHTGMQNGCTYETNDIVALQSDLATLYQNGWSVIPARHVAEWVAGERDGKTLPSKVVAITFDDGYDQDWYNGVSLCPNLPGAYTVLATFKVQHPGYFLEATSFVIASPAARATIGGGTPYLRDDWWAAAENNSGGLLKIGNHSADHDHESITFPLWDPDLGTYLRAAAVEDGSWDMPTQFRGVQTPVAADIEVRAAASFIASKTGRWPDLFAYPYGGASDFMRQIYFPEYGGDHGTYAAFCVMNRAAVRGDDRYCIPRVIHRDAWSTPDQFLQFILEENVRRK